MQLKNVLIIICLIIILFNISIVSASDVNDTIITTENNDKLNEDLTAVHEDSISTSNEETFNTLQKTANTSEEVLSSNNKGTFSDLQDIIDDAPEGSTITLDRDYAYNDEFSTMGIMITKDLTINGNGHTLNGLSKSRIIFVSFALTKDIKVVLNNIKFMNGNTNLYGGAIFNYADLTVNNCVFKNNYAECCGGAINSVGRLNCKNSVFYKNSANGDGGAIFSLPIKLAYQFHAYYSRNGTMLGNMDFIFSATLDTTIEIVTDYINKCSFINNAAKGRGGGAVYAFGHINIKSSTFKLNTANEVGGAVFGGKNLYITYSQFINNQAKMYGGAVYFKCHGTTGKYVNGKWVSRIVYYKNLIQTSTFTKNSASKGGAIYGFKYSDLDKVHGAKAYKCRFEANKATTGRDIYGGSVSKCVFNYLKVTLKDAVVKKSAKRLVLFAALKKESQAIKNKVITFKFNGKTYMTKTNSKGVAYAIINSDILNKLAIGKKVIYQASFGNLIVRKIAVVQK